MSILGPLLFAAFLVVPTWLASMEDTEHKTIAVIDQSHLTYGVLEESEYLSFVYLEDVPIDSVKKDFKSSDYQGVLFVPTNILISNSPILYSDKQLSLSTRMQISNSIKDEIERQKLKAENIENLDEILKSVETKINLRNITWNDAGEERENSTEFAMGIGYIGGLLIYFFIFLFGAMVMRGVIEEKTNRIVEVIISSVKPFQLMMGKIIGIGLVGLTQFVIWVAFTLIISTVVQKTIMDDKTSTLMENMQSRDILADTPSIDENTDSGDNLQFVEEIFSSLHTLNFPLIIGMFIFYFLGGYLLYASFFAIIGSAVDNETDTQQFMLPVTIPLIIGIFVMINTIQNPEGPIAFWFSIIPLTSPIVMMVRIPFNPPVWEILLSVVILVLTFIGSVWMAGKIYRTGILMYGKKVGYKELWKWFRLKN